MGLREHYADLVEHYFRMAVRHKEVKQSSDFDWFLFTSFWIDSLSDKDKQFIRSVFAYERLTTKDGLYQYKNGETMSEKGSRLAAIEKRFAIDSELI